MHVATELGPCADAERTLAALVGSTGLEAAGPSRASDGACRHALRSGVAFAAAPSKIDSTPAGPTGVAAPALRRLRSRRSPGGDRSIWPYSASPGTVLLGLRTFLEAPGTGRSPRIGLLGHLTQCTPFAVADTTKWYPPCGGAFGRRQRSLVLLAPHSGYRLDRTPPGPPVQPRSRRCRQRYRSS